MPCFGASGLSSKAFHLTVTSCRSRRASAFSRRRFPIKHHGQTTSETTSMTERTPCETSTTSELPRDSRSWLMTTIRPPGAARGRRADSKKLQQVDRERFPMARQPGVNSSVQLTCSQPSERANRTKSRSRFCETRAVPAQEKIGGNGCDADGFRRYHELTELFAACEADCDGKRLDSIKHDGVDR